MQNLPSYGYSYTHFDGIESNKCELSSEQCSGEILTWHFAYTHPIYNAVTGVLRPPTEHEIQSDDESSYIALCMHHREIWWQDQRPIWEEKLTEERNTLTSDEA